MSVHTVVIGTLVGIVLLPVLVAGAVAGVFGGDSSLPLADPAVFGDPEGLRAGVLENPAIILSPSARADVADGTVDPRVLGVLLALAEFHELTRVGPIITGHSYYVRGTSRVSNHVHGRAVDITTIDGAPVSPANEGAREAMERIVELPSLLRPDELGGPWALQGGGLRSFTRDHLDHLHIGFRA